MDDPKISSKSNKKGIQIYGDLIIWKELINLSLQLKKNVIFITNDLKEDWCYVDTKESKRIDRPREELVKEFNDTTGNNFWIYSLLDLSYFAGKYLDSNLSGGTIDEIEESISDRNFNDWLRKESAISRWLKDSTVFDVNMTPLITSLDKGYDYNGFAPDGREVLFDIRFSSIKYMQRLGSSNRASKQNHLDNASNYTSQIDYFTIYAFNSIDDAKQAQVVVEDLLENDRDFKDEKVVYYFILGYMQDGLFIFVYSDYENKILR